MKKEEIEKKDAKGLLFADRCMNTKRKRSARKAQIKGIRRATKMALLKEAEPPIYKPNPWLWN